MTDDFRPPQEILDPWERLQRLDKRLQRSMAAPQPHQLDIMHSTLATCLLDIDQRLKLADSKADWATDQILTARKPPRSTSACPSAKDQPSSGSSTTPTSSTSGSTTGETSP